MEFLLSKPNLGYYLVKKENKYYFVFDAYDKPALLHMYEVSAKEVEIILAHNGDGLSLDEQLISEHEFDKVIDRNDFMEKNTFSFRSR